MDGARCDRQLAAIEGPQGAESHPEGDVQFGHSTTEAAAPIPIEAKQACTGKTHAITNVNNTLAAMSFRCLC